MAKRVKRQPGRVSMSAAAVHVDLSVPAFSRLLDMGVIERQPKGHGYDLTECRLARFRYLENLASGRSGPDGGELLSKQRARLATAKAEAEERRNLAASGRLVSLEAVGRVWARGFRNCREHLLSMPGQCADRLTLHTLEDRVQVFEILNQQVCEALTNLADGKFEGDGQVTDHVADDEEVVE
jgi:phage terminase Nu1 subunit (DNA packaging protein)